MKIGKVIGSVVATQKDQNLVGFKLLIVKQLDSKGNFVGEEDEVAVDTFGAGVGELVLLCHGSSARALWDNPKSPVDLAVVGIIDSLEN
jgi:ethanolamine utilization protein EutN